MHSISKLLALFLTLGSVIASSLGEADDLEARGGYGYSRTVYVRSGQSIQSAIKKASPGTTIIVEKGTYPGQITIQKDGITLIGKDAIIEPPTDGKYVTNPCSGFAGPKSEAGICIAGKGIEADEYKNEHRKIKSVAHPVKGVSVSGFTVQNFAGFNILVIGAEGANVHNNKLMNGSNYGFLTAGSSGTEVCDNEISALPTAPGVTALCMDDIYEVKVTGNSISSYIIGLCIQTNGAVVKDNTVTGACLGAFVDPGVKGALVKDNKILMSATFCAQFGIPQAGISLDGSIGAKVVGNYVTGQTNPGGDSSGIVVQDDPCTDPPAGGEKSLACIYLGGPAVAKYNLVKGNKLEKNTLDIRVTTKGKGNVIRWNKCKTSDPAKYCRWKRDEMFDSE